MSTSVPARQRREKLSVLRLAGTLSAFMAISFVGCVVAGYVFSGLRGLMPVSVFPGFSWEQPLTASLGVAWSIGFGAYVGILFGFLYNIFDELGRG